MARYVAAWMDCTALTVASGITKPQLELSGLDVLFHQFLRRCLSRGQGFSLNTSRGHMVYCVACRKDKAAKRLDAVEAERDALKAELLGQKQEAAEQLAVTNTARDAAAAELAEASKQLQAAQADVQRLQGLVSELETAHDQSQGAHSAASKSLTAAQVAIVLSVTHYHLMLLKHC